MEELRKENIFLREENHFLLTENQILGKENQKMIEEIFKLKKKIKIYEIETSYNYRSKGCKFELNK